MAFTSQEQFAKFAGADAGTGSGMTRMYRSTDALRYVVMKDLARLPIDPVGSACQVGRDDIAFGCPGGRRRDRVLVGFFAFVARWSLTEIFDSALLP